MNARGEAERIVESYTPIIMRIGYTYLRSKQDAEDLCQETLLKLIRRTSPFDDLEHEKAWVIRVSINACKNELKSAARLRSANLEEAVAAGSEIAEPSDVLQAVQNLPESYREAIFLHYGEGYKISEIAELVGKSESAVAKDLSRGREMLRKTLGSDFR